jgi:peptidoglycan/LPS O-acetylase OafA/YrhL
MNSPIVSEQSGSALQPSVRIHYLDWLRVLAILFVFLFHAVHPFESSRKPGDLNALEEQRR